VIHLIEGVSAAVWWIAGFILGFFLGSGWAKGRSTPSPSSAVSDPRHVDGPQEPPVEVELIKRVGEQWVRIGSRHPDHPDVHNVRAGLEPGVFIRGEHPDA